MMAALPDRPLRVLFLSAEAEPLIKVGGLGDYSGSLPKALNQVGDVGEIRALDVRVALPFHKTINLNNSNLEKVGNLQVKKKTGFAAGSAYQYTHGSITYYLIKRSGQAAGYDQVYNAKSIQDARKYIFFSLACMELIQTIGWKPDVIHANDWHAAIALHQLSKRKLEDQYFQSIRSLLVIHNLPFMGEGSQQVLKEYGIQPVRNDLLPEWAKLLPLPMGMHTADQIIAVSPGYAKELEQEQFGDGLVHFIRSHKNIKGILNGIDTTVWDPGSDPHIIQNYTAASINMKVKNKESLLERFQMSGTTRTPLLFFVSRLDTQKGVDLMIRCLEEIKERDFNAIILGTGSQQLEKDLVDLESRFPSRIKVVLKFNPELAHQLYAGGDILLMPSRYEPCGLSQMIAMRYGSIPVAHAVGGLKDSIISSPEKLNTGYLFHEFSLDAFSRALQEAMADFKNSEKWRPMQERVMRQDFSWQHSAKEYTRVYAGLVSNIEQEHG